jgi:hypothetical protein
MRAPRRSGAVLIEAILALTLGLFVLVAFAGALSGSLRWIVRLWERAESLDLVYTAWAVLDEELRPGLPGRDWQVHDSGKWVGLRAFRGIARVCGNQGPDGSWPVAVRGRRAAEVGRDSVLVLGRDGGWRPFSLVSAQAGGECVAEFGEVAERWSWTPGLSPEPVLARFFERGEYHLSEGALRYRRGAGGRQPLTPERLGSGSGFSPIPGGVEVALEFSARVGEAPIFYRWTVRGAGRSW